MAEDDKTEQDDFEKVQGFIKDQVKQYAEELFAERGRAQQTQSPGNQQLTADQQQRQQAKSFITDIIGDDLNRTSFTAADAKDYVGFYLDNPLAQEYKDQIEKTFETLAAAGRGTARSDIFDYVRGREMRTDPDGFATKESARKQKQLDRASDAADFGVGSMNRAREDSRFSNFESKTVEEMEKALEGIAF